MLQEHYSYNIFFVEYRMKTVKEKIMYSVNAQKKTFDFFSEHSSCPTCEQTIEESFRQEKIENLRQSMLEKKDGVAQLLEKIQHWSNFQKESETSSTSYRS